ncbi:uncharacterized protein BKCO1_19000129 [Diplodia corticola]|uniref:Uncharacterized protein n=1 Tax=Diplodia corticola TaxID=236234 RepID=A0A1J9R368_9PEZI|nr:uncharacterized protein BKCO1_19000129 [Diplodia corticola]OJD35056.1 hypothetical protein BKCO1_19000129 [Diplodia corticola]
MFRSRRRATSNPPPNRNTSAPTPTAALAASQAFLKNANSNASLSSAAAAAALRTHSPPPVSVGSIQTKRMQRRGSSGSSASAPGMRRQPSSGSMSERTFRSPSPSGRAWAPAPADANAPPVPAIPKDISPASKHRRAASEAVLGSGKPRDQSTGEWASRNSPDAKEGTQRGSINFSRPMSPRETPPASPPPPKKGHSGWFTSPVTSDQKPRQDIRTTAPIVSKSSTTSVTGLGLSLQNAANAPVAKKKKKKAVGTEGRHLAEGGMASKPRGDAISPESSPPARTQSPQRSAPAPELPPSPQSPQSSILSDSSSESEAPGPQSRPSPLVRQPSTVMENPEVEEEAERAEAGGRAEVASEVPAKVMVSKEQEQRTVGPQVEQRLGRGADSEKLKPDTGRAKGHQRQSSLSPARSAHFAPTAVDISTGVKHQPPPRSISPAKSAMKHSPSSSIRTGSPVAPHTAGRAQSDGGSEAGSHDGYKPSPRKKKGVRVSFEENITQEDSSSSPSSPAGLESSRWSGRTLQGMDDDLDEIMKPRPELPSFGSIRRERRPVGEEIAEKVTETVPSMSNSTSTMAEPLEASSDHAVGGIIAQSLETKKRTKSGNQPIAPDVTSVEGTGYASDDTESSMDESETASNHEAAANGVGSGTNTLPAIPEKKSAEPSPALDVPSVPQIAVQPATPGTDAENQDPPFEMPGAWSDLDEGSADESVGATTASLTSQEHPGTNDPGYGGQFHVFSARDLQPVTSHQSSVDRYLNHSADESSDDESDGSSVYSDAAEDPSELEGGFASLDAIVESPVIPPPSEVESVSPPESPIVDKQGQQSNSLEKDSVATPSTVEMRRGEQPDKPVSNKPRPKSKATVKAAALEYDAAPILKSPKPKKKATVVPEPIVVAAGPAQKAAPLPHAREAPQPKKPALRTSMRAGRPATEQEGTSVPAVRKSMRTSMRDSPAGHATARYSEPATVEAREPKGALQKRNIPLAAPAQNRRSAPAGIPATSNRVSATPALGRTLSNDSDASDSSFKRQRRGASSYAEGRYSMRRSMRSGPSPKPHASAPAPTLRATPPSAAPAPRSSRLSIRSLSPTGSLFGKRKPMINNQESPQPTLRAQGPPPAKSSRFSTGGKGSPKLGSSRFQSRYEDSSDDEDVGRLPKFRSRFADSDEEDDVTELPSELRPVRGIPRRADDDGDSTELEDELSDTDGPSSPVKRPAAATNGNTNGATAEPKSSLRDIPVSPTRKEKRGFFGLGKKRRDSADVPPKTPPETAAPAAAASPRAKLQRRDSHGRRTSESWPLPPAIPDEDPSMVAGRPTTSDGSPTRPRLNKRRSTGGETAESEPVGNVAVGRSGKKKKFPMLRKAFRLKD